MASPVTGTDVDAAVPTVFSSICSGFKSLFLLGPLMAEWFHWAFDSSGNATEDFKALFVSVGVPTGGIVDWPIGVSIPVGYVEANGQILSVALYPALAQVYGSTFGGDGIATFGVPDFGGRVRLGRNGTYPVNSTGGLATVQLTETQNGPHTHVAIAAAQGDAFNKIWGSGIGASTAGNVYASNHGLAVTGTAETPIETTLTVSGDGADHENMMPYRTCVTLIKT